MIRTDRLMLTPLVTDDAIEMVGVLADLELYRFTGGSPPSLDELTARYRAQAAGSPTPNEGWHNWIIRLADSDSAVGFVQATTTTDRADIAWLVGLAWQGQGIAREAAAAMCEWLRDRGVRHLTAHIHPDHAASARVAAKLGLVLTEEVDGDGECVWAQSS